jgi:hypothetical protein
MKEIQRRNAELIMHDQRGLCSSRIGTYSNDVTVALAKKFKGKTVSIRDIVRVQYGRMNNHNEQYVRSKLTKAVNMLLQSGIPAFPVYEATGSHKKVGIKVISEYNEEDFQQLTEYQDAAVTRGDLSYEKAELVKSVARGLKPEEADESDNEKPDPA